MVFAYIFYDLHWDINIAFLLLTDEHHVGCVCEMYQSCFLRWLWIAEKVLFLEVYSTELSFISQRNQVPRRRFVLVLVTSHQLRRRLHFSHHLRWQITDWTVWCFVRRSIPQRKPLDLIPEHSSSHIFLPSSSHRCRLLRACFTNWWLLMTISNTQDSLKLWARGMNESPPQLDYRKTRARHRTD